MFTLGAVNMILRGDGSSKINKNNFFDIAGDGGLLEEFSPTKGLVNPPFSYSENGMPFVLGVLDKMTKGGKLAVIIQDSAGTGKAIKTNKEILSKHSLEGSIKMPGDLFEPSAGVQTSIYIFTAGQPHDVKKNVRFIDLSSDGYKRTGRGTRKVGEFEPEQRYKDALSVFKYGGKSEDNTTKVELIDDTISLKGDDWNFTQHQKYDTTPTEEDFLSTIGSYMSFELDMILQGKGHLIGLSDEVLEKTSNIIKETEREIFNES